MYETTSRRYLGAAITAQLFLAIAVVVIFVGVIVGVSLALTYDCRDPQPDVGSCGTEGVTRVLLFFGPTLAALLYALPISAVGYILVLLRAIEANTRRY